MRAGTIARRLLCLPALLSLVACGGVAPATPTPTTSPTPTAQTVDFFEFTHRVNRSRMAALQTDAFIDLSPWTEDFPQQTQAFTASEIELLITPHTPDRALTREELAQDVETAFLLLKTTYGAYDYFGGDEVFLPLRDAALAELEGMRYPTGSLLGEILYHHLAPILQDGHFSLGGQQPIEQHQQTMYYVPDLYLDDISGLDAAYLKPTIAEDGRLAYGFATMTAAPEELPKTATLQGEAVPLSWQAATPAGRQDYAFAETTWEGVPVLESKRMSHHDLPEWKAQLERFSACGEEYSQTPLLIFDVRSNGGGSDIYVMDWFLGFTGQAADPKQAFAHKVSQLGVSHSTRYPPDLLGQWRSYTSPGSWTEHDGLVLLLQDAATASSGETAVQFFRSMDHVVIVGSNSGGCSLTPNNLHFYLPHSGLDLYFGTGLSFCESTENRDGVGYLPDLWVDPIRAQEAVTKLISYYSLPHSTT